MTEKGQAQALHAGEGSSSSKGEGKAGVVELPAHCACGPTLQTVLRTWGCAGSFRILACYPR